MSNFYEKYQSMIEDFVNNNLDYIEDYCIYNDLDYIGSNNNHNIDIECFFEKLPNNLKDNYNFILDSIKYKSDFLRYASDNLKNNYDIVLAAVEKNGYFLKYASDDLKNNYDIVLTAVKNNFVFKKYTSDDLNINNYGLYLDLRIILYALNYASDNLKNNYDIILTAVQKEGYMFRFASENLKNNYNIALNAIENDFYYEVVFQLPLNFIKNRKLLVNMNNIKHYTKYYKENMIIKIMDYKFKIKENKLLKQNLNSIFNFF